MDDQAQEFSSFVEQVRWEREHPWWRPGAMRPEERERLVRIGLQVVLGDRDQDVNVFRNGDDTIEVAEHGRSFGFSIDTVLGDDKRVVFEHDLQWLIDELCEFDVAWAKRLPECPLHPNSHALRVTVTDTAVRATCPTGGIDVRTAEY